MFIKKKGLIVAVLVAGISLFNACGEDSSNEPDIFGLDSSSSILTGTVNESSDSESIDSSSSQEDTTTTNKKVRTPSEESRLPKVEDQEGPHYSSYAIQSTTEKDGFTIIVYDRHFCRGTTYNSVVISSTYSWDSISRGFEVIILKKADNGLYKSGHSTMDMKYVYENIEKLQDPAALAEMPFYTGTSENIYGEWTYQPDDTSTPIEGKAIILTQDSVHFLTYINPEINYTTPNDLYFDFGEVFGKEIYSEISDKFYSGYNVLGDIPSRGIKLTQSDSSIFIDMNGQQLEYLVKKKYTKRTKSIQYIIKSGEDRCSYTTYTQELMEREFCSSKYEDYIKIRGYNTQNEIYQLEDPGYKGSYIYCFKKLIENNPALKQESDSESNEN